MFFISDYQFYLKEFTDEIKQDFEKLEKLEKEYKYIKKGIIKNIENIKSNKSDWITKENGDKLKNYLDKKTEILNNIYDLNTRIIILSIENEDYNTTLKYI